MRATRSEVTSLFVGLGAALVALWCVLPAQGAPEKRVQTARFAIHGADGDREWAIGVWAPELAKAARLPLVIAFHGMGESKAGKDAGYRAWVDRYGVVDAYEALLAPPLSKEAFGGLVRPPELERLNAELAGEPYKGVFVVGVYTPDLLAEIGTHPERIEAFARWVATRLVPKVRDTFPVAAAPGPRQVGVDGVSLGGMVALEVGLRHPEVFGAVGAMQPAVRGREAELAERAAAASAKAPQAIRLLSSDEDPLLPVTRLLSVELRKRRVDHTLVVTPGGHDYAFNKGPGAIELLHFQDRALRKVPSP